MAEKSPFRVEIKPSACTDNPIVRSKIRKKRIWEFESKHDAEEWVESINESCENELILSSSYLQGKIADARLEGKAGKRTWTGI